MRLLTFSVLKSWRLHPPPPPPPPPLARARAVRPRSDSAAARASQPQHEIERAVGDPNLLEFAESWSPTEEPELRAAVARDLRVLPEFCSEAEETGFLAELEPVLKRMRYEFDHWDNAIQGYRETERVEWRAPNAAVLTRLRAVAFPPRAAGAAPAERAERAERAAGEPLPLPLPLPHAHVLDLAPSGHIKPHVDAVRFCGEVIAGLCLGSAAVMRLQHAQHAHLALDALLPRRALYIMRGVARYEFTHAVLGNEQSWWRGERVVKGRRVSVIVRSRAPPQPGRAPPQPPQPSQRAGAGGGAEPTHSTAESMF